MATRVLGSRIARTRAGSLHHSTRTPDRRALFAALEQHRLPTSFAGHSFTRWGVDKLQRVLLLFDLRKSQRVKTSEFELCLHLLNTKAGLLSDAEQAAVDSIYRGASLDQARQVLRTGQATYQETLPQSQLRACAVCYEELPVEEFPSIPSDAGCKHQITSVCTTCFTNHIEAQADMRPLDEILCPEEDCNEILSFYQMLRNSATTTFERYDTYLALKGLQFYHCANSSCQSGGVIDPRFNSWMTCNDCETNTCVTCLTPWHTGISCEQNDLNRKKEQIQDSNEAKTAVYMKEEAKRCPSCGIPIEKNGGCDHMTCSECLFEFCWICLADYDQIAGEGNDRHEPSCEWYRGPAPYYAGNVVEENRREREGETDEDNEAEAEADADDDPVHSDNDS